MVSSDGKFPNLQFLGKEEKAILVAQHFSVPDKGYFLLYFEVAQHSLFASAGQNSDLIGIFGTISGKDAALITILGTTLSSSGIVTAVD